MTTDPIDLYNLRKLVDSEQLDKLRRYAKAVIGLHQHRRHVDTRDNSIAASVISFDAPRGGISIFSSPFGSPQPVPERDLAILALQRLVNNTVRENALDDITDDMLCDIGDALAKIPEQRTKATAEETADQITASLAFDKGPS
jgi:hypothetical protein